MSKRAPKRIETRRAKRTYFRIYQCYDNLMESLLKELSRRWQLYMQQSEEEFVDLIDTHDGELDDLLMQMNAAVDTKAFWFLHKIGDLVTPDNKMVIMSFLDRQKFHFKDQLQSMAEEAYLRKKRRVFGLLEELRNELKYDLAKRHFEDNDALKQMDPELAQLLQPAFQHRYDRLMGLYSQQLEMLEALNLKKTLSLDDFHTFRQCLHHGIDEILQQFRQDCEAATHFYLGRERPNLDPT